MDHDKSQAQEIVHHTNIRANLNYFVLWCLCLAAVASLPWVGATVERAAGTHVYNMHAFVVRLTTWATCDQGGDKRLLLKHDGKSALNHSRWLDLTQGCARPIALILGADLDHRFTRIPRRQPLADFSSKTARQSFCGESLFSVCPCVHVAHVRLKAACDPAGDICSHLQTSEALVPGMSIT